MAAPSKSFTVISDGDIDPDSPITTGLMTELRDNDQHLESWLGESFVAAVDHDHDGVNSKGVSGAQLRLIERRETAADETSFDFSATLDGDTESVYLLTGRWKKNTTGSPILSLRVNTATATTIATLPATPNIGFAFLFGIIFAKRTVQATSMEIGYIGLSVDTGTPAQALRGDNFTLGANLTSLGLVASLAGDQIKKGSAFTLYEVIQT